MYAGEVTQWRGNFVEVSYYATDEKSVLALSSALDETIREACEVWSCPLGMRFDLRFLLDDATTQRRFDYFRPEPSAPWLYSVLLSKRETFEGSLTVLLPAPHAAGAPADAGSQHVYQSGIGVELLARLAAHLAPLNRRYNALPYALAARLGADLGLEAATVAETRSAPAVYTAAELWQLNFMSTERPFGPYYTLAAQQQALATVNGLLEGQPPEAAGRLFSGLATAPNAELWVANALRTTRADGAERLQTALEPAALATTPGLLTAANALTVGCRDGLADLATRQSAPQYALVGRAVGAEPLAWSPNGEYLLANFSGRPGVVTAATGAVAWLPAAEGYLDHAEWATESIVAYTVWPYDAVERRFDAAAFRLNFFDVAQPEQSPAPLSGVLTYALSPDRETAAVVLADLESQVFSRSGSIVLMPALGGPPTEVGMGQSPAWSPDGQEVAWVGIRSRAESLYAFDLATGRNRELQDSTWGARSDFSEFELTWSPRGDMLAVVTKTGTLDRAYGIWLFPTQGGQARGLLIGSHPAYAHPVGFSADGRYLSVETWDRYWPRLTRVYETALGEEVLTLPTAGGEMAWAPEGHTLAFGSFEGLALMNEPETGEVTPVTREPCYAALWN